MEASPIEQVCDGIRRARVYDVARETPLDPASRLSERLGARVLLKREDLQPVFSFKLRGAYNKIVSLDAAAARAGLVTASAGNHAQGVALAAAKLGHAATIVMPGTTPESRSTRYAPSAARWCCTATPSTMPGHEVQRRERADRRRIRPPLRRPAGDRGAGHRRGRDPAAASGSHRRGVRARGRRRAGRRHARLAEAPAARDGVSSRSSPTTPPASTRRSTAGRPVPLATVGIFADGAAVRQVGDAPFARHPGSPRRAGPRVGIDEICAAIQDLFEDTRVLAEPAGRWPWRA